ncbi:hypothetical protein BVRB_4g094970 [Beta vulgaris subsp. vulgaris]|uniref:Uncharacterized protein n=1 Tax=Beta vulgaris subsp. vulgaris TaxID=3555 RepID=A0A0J8BA24_BETVV|nr:uncharacterized protein LOC104907461 [Beta vulgaris subsp. vulgaris]KMS98169.1 hypothetical protein BVRB_4g094970 [Beta vulgaris subsp. vulgaris]
MQSSSNKSHENHDERTNGEDDSLMMTINYLRARLLSERSISKAAKERTDELAIRVKELEQQLKVVTLQRKRAEKAALDVFSYLESLGVSDISEVCDSDSNEEEPQCESDMDKGDTTKDDKKYSGSEPESTPSFDRSLFWKGRKERTRLLEKKSLNSPVWSRTNLVQVNSSPRHRLGKSCRQIKKREPRSTVEETRRDSGKSAAQESSGVDCFDHCLDCLDFRSEESKKSPENCGDRYSQKEEISHSFQAQAQEYDAGSSTHERECSGEMKRALQHQAQLIRCYEAQEKAQRIWEQKYGENDDSCEPGDHSDVTEERDEGKAVVPQSIEADECDGHDQKAGTETNSEGGRLSAQFNSFKVSHDADPECSEEQNVSEMQPFSVLNSNQSSKHAARHSLHAGEVDPLANDSASFEHQSLHTNGPRALVPYEKHARMGMVLEALQEAKLLVKQKMIFAERPMETSAPANKEVDWLKLPVGCSGLFRVPTDPEVQAPSPIKFSSSDFPSEPTSSNFNSRTPPVQGHQYIPSPMGSRFGNHSGDPFSERQPRYDFQFNTNVSAPSPSNLSSNSNSSFPDFFPRMPSNQMMFSQFPGSEAGMPPSAYPFSFQNHDVRPHIYR